MTLTDNIEHISNSLAEAMQIVIDHDKATRTDQNMDLSDWNETWAGKVVGTLGDVVELLQLIEEES